MNDTHLKSSHPPPHSVFYFLASWLFADWFFVSKNALSKPDPLCTSQIPKWFLNRKFKPIMNGKKKKIEKEGKKISREWKRGNTAALCHRVKPPQSSVLPTKNFTPKINRGKRLFDPSTELTRWRSNFYFLFELIAALFALRWIPRFIANITSYQKTATEWNIFSCFWFFFFFYHRHAQWEIIYIGNPPQKQSSMEFQINLFRIRIEGYIICEHGN